MLIFFLIFEVPVSIGWRKLLEPDLIAVTWKVCHWGKNEFSSVLPSTSKVKRRLTNWEPIAFLKLDNIIVGEVVAPLIKAKLEHSKFSLFFAHTSATERALYKNHGLHFHLLKCTRCFVASETPVQNNSEQSGLIGKLK